ncbi:hypothetical protein [Bifidobacterium oedipodis]|uniref:Signal transduction histidine kinase subgroup 3 dimerisation and phosphoacceptor domain-containing protein n=1 Tax=Bifidobacterium oedipodis TaxID=2675322 RepID=A0A7Y0ERW6_9BIFI|nr:hypothetical protein [Bifidobacterium sp. DSM 109957]NMM94858.1 hypothetical protein [Bifidobacterium sp. DSM 109957]
MKQQLSMLVQRAHTFISQYPWRCAVTVFIVVLSIIDWMAASPINTYSCVVGVLHLLVVAALPVFPQIGCLALMVLELAGCLYPAVGGPSRLWGVCFAIGLFAYCEGTLGAAILAAAGFSILQLGQIITYSDYGQGLDYGSGVSLLGVLVFSAMAGYICRQVVDKNRGVEQKAAELVQDQARRQYEQNLSIAAQLHDKIANGLTTIALESQKNLERSGNSANTASWQLVAEQSARSIQELHAVIDCLSLVPSDEYAGVISEQLHDELAQWCSRQDEAMHNQGLQGRARINDFGLIAKPIASRKRLLFDVLAEVYVDISKHCERQGTYQMTITLCDNSVEITQTNALAKSESRTSYGKGLQIYNGRIEAAGGMLSATAQNEQWNLYVFIPMS